MTALLSVTDLHVSYGKVEAVTGVSLEMQAGHIVTVIGPNGAGKTTLLAALMGLLPSKGESWYEAQDLRILSTEERVRRGICLVPERRELFTEMTVADNLVLGAYTGETAKPCNGICRRSTSASRACPSGAGNSPAPCPAENARCWRSGAR